MPNPDRPSIASEYKFWFGLIGALISAGSIISLIQKLFDVGLIPVFASALSYYRGVTYPLVDWLRYIISYIPYLDLYRYIFFIFMSLETYRDLTVLSFVMAGAAARASAVPDPIVGTRPRSSFPAMLLYTAFMCLLAYTLFPLLLGVILPLALLVNNSEDRIFTRYLLLNLLIAFTAAGVFFAANELMK
jgi:hypothetical protein